MNHKTKYPSGSPRDILVRLYRKRREIRQMLTDVQSINDNNPNFAKRPMNVGIYIVQLKKIDGVIASVRHVIRRGEPKLPGGILDPVLGEF